MGNIGKLKTSIPKEDWDVHRTHCCVKHGCKYGQHNECPVTLNLVKQKYPCQYCNEENIYDELSEVSGIKERLINYIDSRIENYSGGDEMKSLNESVTDSFIVRELEIIKSNIIKNNF